MTAKLAANFTTALVALRDRKEAGATGLEYAGMIMVAAMVVGIVYTAVKEGNVASSIATEIGELFSGSGS
jgi:hypothetical protein